MSENRIIYTEYIDIELKVWPTQLPHKRYTDEQFNTENDNEQRDVNMFKLVWTKTKHTYTYWTKKDTKMEMRGNLTTKVRCSVCVSCVYGK